MRIGLLGGSFNFAHEGHVYISNLALKKLNLKQIWWIPTSQNPFKDKNSYAPFEDRIKECLKITEKHPKIYVKNFYEHSFSTYKLLKKINAQHPQIEFYFIIGADNIANLHKWKNFVNLIKIVNFAIFSRNSFLIKARKTKAFALYQSLAKKHLSKIFLFKTKNYDISASAIRAKSKNN